MTEQPIPTVDNNLNPFSNVLSKMAAHQTAPAADTTPETIADAQKAADEAAPPVSAELLNNNTPAEIPVEEPATDPVETPAEAPIEPDSFFSDPLKNKPAQTDPVVEATELANEYKAIQNDPDFQLFMEYKKAGKSLGDLTSDFKYTDYTKMDGEQLLKEVATLRKYTPEEVEDALTELNGLGKLSKDREIATMRAELEARQNEQRQTLYGTVKEQADMQAKARTQYATEAQQIGAEMIGKDYNGVKLDAEKQKDWMEFQRTFSLMRQDGTVATEEIFKIWLHRLIPQIQSNAASKSHHQGREEILKEVTRPVKEAPNGKLPIQAGTPEVKHDPAALTKQMTASPTERPRAV